MGWRQDSPEPGWGGRAETTELRNPRPPAVPASLQLTLAEYFTAAAAIGLLSAQPSEPDRDWLLDKAFDYGDEMARRAEARRRR